MQDINKNPMLDVFNADIVKGARFSIKYEFPIIQKTGYKPTTAIPFNIARRSKKLDQWLHFYIYDYLFECVWKNPEKYLPLLKKFQGVITPDFSLYRNLPLAMQIWNTYRNRALGYWLQNNGIKTVINVRWSDERSYDFAFEGLEKGGTYAVGSTGGIQKKLSRYHFTKGLERMVEILEPATIINYSNYSKDIFENYEKLGINVITIKHWSDTIKGGE